MMGPRQVAQGALFYQVSIEEFVPGDHPLRGIDLFLDLSGVRPLLAPFYSSHGRPSIDAELMIRMLLPGYGHGISSGGRHCEEVHVKLAYRWFCRLDPTGSGQKRSQVDQRLAKRIIRQLQGGQKPPDFVSAEFRPYPQLSPRWLFHMVTYIEVCKGNVFARKLGPGVSWQDGWAAVGVGPHRACTGR